MSVRPMADTLPLLKGTLDVLVLKALSWAPMHGFEITAWLESRSDGALGVQDSALYQALHRLEERGLTAAEWGVTSNNQPTASPRRGAHTWPPRPRSGSGTPKR